MSASGKMIEESVKNGGGKHRSISRRSAASEKSAADMLREQIERKERFARTLYRENKPRKADRVMHEVMTLQAKLRKLDEKGCKYL